MAAGTTRAAAAKAAFVANLSKLTGLSTKTVQTWVAAEGADAANGTGGYNYANVRARPGSPTGYSGVSYAGVSSAGFAQFRSPADAARETAYWIEAMPNYQGIRTAAGKGVAAELAAIARSPWDQNHYADSTGRAGAKLVTALKATGGGGGGITGAITGAVGGVTGAVGGIVHDLNPANVAGDVAGAVGGAVSGAATTVVEGFLRLIVFGVILGLAAVLFYNGIRRLSGDRLPSSRDLRDSAAALGGDGELSPEAAALFAA